MRYVNLVNQAGVRRRVPVGKLSAEIICGSEPHTIDLIDAATGTISTFWVSSRMGESQRLMAPLPRSLLAC